MLLGFLSYTSAIHASRGKTMTEDEARQFVRRWDVQTIYNHAVTIYNDQNYPNRHGIAAILLQAAANKKYQPAMFLAAIYWTGTLGTPQNMREAIRLFRKLADCGHLDAKYNLGIIYRRGNDGNPPNWKAAREFFIQGARANHLESQHELACLSYTGDGHNPNTQDRELAARIFAEAANHGHTPSIYNLACMCRDGDGIPQDSRRAIKLFEQCGDEDLQSMINLADLLIVGRNEDYGNIARGIELLEAAQKRGDASASRYLIQLYVSDASVRDLEKAQRVCQEAIDADLYDARELYDLIKIIRFVDALDLSIPSGDFYSHEAFNIGGHFFWLYREALGGMRGFLSSIDSHIEGITVALNAIAEEYGTIFYATFQSFGAAYVQDCMPACWTKVVQLALQRATVQEPA
jgi:TPR repeat protein